MNQISCFTDYELERILGEPIIAADSFEDLFSDEVAESAPESYSHIAKHLIPTVTKPLLDYAESAATAWLTKNKVFEGAEQLLSINIRSLNSLDIRIKLATAAVPGKWARYSFASGLIDYLAFPDPADIGLIFDVETFVSQGNYPIIATAIGASGAYLYIDQAFDGSQYNPGFIDLGPFKRVIVAHNASFDFCRISQRYQFDNPVTAICTQGMGRALYSIDSQNDWRLNDSSPTSKQIQDNLASRLNLVSLYNFVTKNHVDKAIKETRNLFVDAIDFNEFIVAKDELLEYAVNDVILTLELFQHLYPSFTGWLGSSIPLQGFIQSADALAPISATFEDWLAANYSISEQTNYQLYSLLKPHFDELHQAYQEDWLTFKEDSQLAKLDWRLQKPKNYRKKVLPIGYPKLARWYVSFLNGTMSMSGNDIGYALMLHWKGEPIFKTVKHGWVTKSGERLPHPSGDVSKNLGGMMSAPIKAYVEQDLLTSKLISKEQLLEIYTILDSVALIDSYGPRISSMFYQ